MTTIRIYTRSVYGRPLVYAADAAQAKSLAALTGAKTLEPRHITALQELGFAFTVVADPLAAQWLSRENVALLKQA